MKRAYATGRRVAPRRKPMLTDWAPEEEALVLRLAGTMPLAHIPARLNAECLGARSVWAVRDRIYHLGASPQVAAYSVADLMRAFGVGSRVLARWIHAGWLTAERVEDRPGRQWYIYEASVERFIRERAGVYYWPGIRVRRWRNLAEVVARRHPWVPLVDMAARLGLAATTLHRWMQLGRLPAVWQNGAGCRVRRWMVDANVATDLARARAPQHAQERAS